MTQYATPRSAPAFEANDARLYWKLTGPVLLAVALLGFALDAIGRGALLGAGFLAFDWAHNGVHLLLAAVGLYLGFGGVTEVLAKNAAKVFGVVYLLLAVVGFMSANVFGLGDAIGLHFEIGENLIHLALGAYGAYVGFSA